MVLFKSIFYNAIIIAFPMATPFMVPSTFHVALIMDGNGRWAKQQGKPRIWGHKQGAKTLRKIIQSCPNYGITHLTAYAFSPENWNRHPSEVAALMRLFKAYLRAYISELEKEQVQLRIIGDIASLSPSLQRWIADAHKKTQHHTRLVVQIALNYGGQDELVHAMRTLVARYQKEGLDPQVLTKADIAKALWTYPCPDPDLMIRTGGEMRLSNYMLWQLSYTELMFCKEHWPDFSPHHLESAVAQFHRRQRRFGHIPHDDATVIDPSSLLIHTQPDTIES